LSPDNLYFQVKGDRLGSVAQLVRAPS
jgi:hypothetical protein